MCLPINSERPTLNLAAFLQRTFGRQRSHHRRRPWLCLEDETIVCVRTYRAEHCQAHSNRQSNQPTSCSQTNVLMYKKKTYSKPHYRSYSMPNYRLTINCQVDTRRNAIPPKAIWSTTTVQTTNLYACVYCIPSRTF